MRIKYTGHFIDDQNNVCVCLSVSVGGGPPRHQVVKIWARAFDNEDVHDAMARAALSLQESHNAPPWEQDALPLWAG